jgi:hypothetical protein
VVFVGSEKIAPHASSFVGVKTLFNPTNIIDSQ